MCVFTVVFSLRLECFRVQRFRGLNCVGRVSPCSLFLPFADRRWSITIIYPRARFSPWWRRNYPLFALRLGLRQLWRADLADGLGSVSGGEQHYAKLGVEALYGLKEWAVHGRTSTPSEKEFGPGKRDVARVMLSLLRRVHRWSFRPLASAANAGRHLPSLSVCERRLASSHAQETSGSWHLSFLM